jgi:hypothetical protein
MDADLFDFSSYPLRPGSKGGAETSLAAARDIAPKAHLIREKVLAVVTEAGSFGCIPEEGCAKLDLPRPTVQPRFSELAAVGAIVDSGRRRRNPSSGKRAIVWVLPRYAGRSE